MNTSSRGICGLAVLMVLTGCSGGSPDDVLPGRGPTISADTTSPGPDTTGPSRPDESAAPTGDGSQLSAGQLESVLEAVNEAKSLNAQVIPDAELRALEDEGARRAENIVVTPEECDVYADSSADDLSANASRAAMTFAGESSLQPDTVSLSSLPTATEAGAQLQASRSELEACSEFTLDVSNEVIMMTVVEVAVTTAADEDLALRTTAQVPGTIQQSITVRAVVGSTVVDVLVGVSADPEADIARAERLADLLVEQLRAP